MEHPNMDGRNWAQSLLITYVKAKIWVQKEKEAIEKQVAATRYVNVQMYFMSLC